MGHQLWPTIAKNGLNVVEAQPNPSVVGTWLQFKFTSNLELTVFLHSCWRKQHQSMYFHHFHSSVVYQAKGDTRLVFPYKKTNLTQHQQKAQSKKKTRTIMICVCPYVQSGFIWKHIKRELASLFKRKRWNVLNDYTLPHPPRRRWGWRSGVSFTFFFERERDKHRGNNIMLHQVQIHSIKYEFINSPCTHTST